MASSSLLRDLPLENQNEIIKFMKFFKDKREQTLSAIDGDFADVIEDRIRSADPPYSLGDIESAVNHLQIVVKDGVRSDLSKMTSMNVLLLKHLLESAEAQGGRLHIDTSIIENEALISEVEKIRLDFLQADAKSGPKISKLKSMKDETMDLINDKNALESSNKTLQQRFTTMQQQLAQATRDNAALRDEARLMASAQGKGARETAATKDEPSDARASGDLAAAQRDLAESRAQLRRTEDDLEAKVSSTPQFTQMKKLMADKTRQVQDLRDRLRKYEPDIDADDRVRS